MDIQHNPAYRWMQCNAARIKVLNAHAASGALLPAAAYLTRERLDKAKKLQLIINLSEGAGLEMTDECWAPWSTVNMHACMCGECFM